MGDDGVSRPSAVATVVDLGQGSSSAPATPASSPAFMRQTASVGSADSLSLMERRRSTLTGVAIGLGAAAAMAVLSVGGLWLLTRDSGDGDASAGLSSTAEGAPEAAAEPKAEPEVPEREPASVAEPAGVEEVALDEPQAEPENAAVDADGAEPEDELVIVDSEPKPLARPNKPAQHESRGGSKATTSTKKKRKPDPDAFWPE
jgi:hypothetical protein